MLASSCTVMASAYLRPGAGLRTHLGGPLAAPIPRVAVRAGALSVPASEPVPPVEAPEPTPSLVTVPQPPQVVPEPGVVPPAGAFAKAVALGTAKAKMPAWKIFWMGLAGGAYIGFGALLVLSVGASCPGLMESNPGAAKAMMGAFGLPFGLLMVLVCGAELYTGNTALVTAAVAEEKATLGELAKSWFFSYLGNFVGSLLLVSIVASSGLLAASAAPAKIALAKTSMTFGQAFFRGLLCNWLVCNAIWQATAASTLSGKAVGVFFPISAFVAMGMEHSVANMFLIPMGIINGAATTWGSFLMHNLLPVTLGNTCAGVFCMGLFYCVCFGKLGARRE